MDASQHFNAPFRSRLEQLGYHVSSPHHHEVTLSIEALQDALMALHSDCKASSNPTPHISAFVGKFEKAVAVLQGLRVNTQDFDVIKTLATGAVGRVCLVAGKVDKRVYAMKVLKKTDLLTRREAAFFMEERNALVFAQNSRWIITLHAAFQDEENLYLLMEYVAGGSLRGLLNSRNTIMTEDEARFYIAEIILGLEEVHKYNYIHRDIKPENVLIDTKGHLKLGDFGSCIRVGETEQITSHETVGTPDYISPEILRAQEGRASYGKEVDLWSLGIILYELIYDEVPFYSESLVATYGKIMDHENTLKFPAGPSDSAIDLMKRLICSSDKRLGKSGIEELKSHVWFQGFNWSQLLEMTPPFIPHLNGPQDTRYFEDEDNESKKFSKKPLGKSRDFTGQNLPFIGYTYLQDATPSFSWPFEMAISSQATSSRTNFGVTAELEAVMSQNTTYSHQITELELAVTRALDEKKRIEIDLKRSQSLAAHETAEKEELESRIRSFRKRQQDHDVEMEVRLSTVEHERDTLLDQLATLKENALSREEMFAKQEVYKMQLQKTNEFLQQEIERLKSKLSDEKMTLRTLQAKIDLLTQKMEDENEFRATSTIERNDMSEQFQVALQKVSSLESALAAEVEKANLASAALCEMERSKCIVEIELKTARNQLEMANAKRLPKDSDRVLGIKDLHAQIESLLKQNSSYVDEMSQLTKSNAQLELEIADINEQRNEKLNQFQLTVQVTNNMEVKLREYEKKIAALEKQRSAREAQHAAALAEKNAALQDARDEILKIQSSLSKLNESLSQKSLDVIAIRQSLLEREQSITNLKITNTELLNHFENDRQTIEKLECSVHTLQQESNRQSLECFRHADTISELRNENERLRDEKTLRRASINDLDLQTSVIARLEQSLREKAAALTESETHRALEINQNLLLQDRVRELENWSLALQDEWEVNKAKFNGTGTSTPTYTMSPTAESRSDKNKLKLRSLFFRSQQQRQDQERAMQKLHDAESDFRSVDTPVHTRQKSNGSFQSLVSHFTRHSEQSLCEYYPTTTSVYIHFSSHACS
ncbi:kinase-like domain-containing protein [Chytriomyces sp. MP71]|nr:kinase-like domain-containing protein [Chytriomyces sp. MP71]